MHAGDVLSQKYVYAYMHADNFRGPTVDDMNASYGSRPHTCSTELSFLHQPIRFLSCVLRLVHYRAPPGGLPVVIAGTSQVI